MKIQIASLALVSLMSSSSAFAWDSKFDVFLDTLPHKKIPESVKLRARNSDFFAGKKPIISGKKPTLSKEFMLDIESLGSVSLKRVAKAHNQLVEDMRQIYGDIDVLCSGCRTIYKKFEPEEIVKLGPEVVLSTTSLVLLMTYERDLGFHDVADEKKLSIINSMSIDAKKALKYLFINHLANKSRALNPIYIHALIEILNSCPSDIKESIEEEPIYPENKGC